MNYRYFIVEREDIIWRLDTCGKWSRKYYAENHLTDGPEDLKWTESYNNGPWGHADMEDIIAETEKNYGEGSFKEITKVELFTLCL